MDKMSNAHRDKIKNIFTVLFKSFHEEEHSYSEFYKNFEKMGKNFEKSIYNSTIRNCRGERVICTWENQNFIDKYLSNARRLKAYLTYLEHRTELKKKLFNEEIKLTDIASMTSYDLLSDELKKKIQEDNHDILRKKMIGVQTVENVNGTFKCGKCKSKKTTYYQRQTRSADEPMTVFVECLNCGNRWKF